MSSSVTPAPTLASTPDNATSASPNDSQAHRKHPCVLCQKRKVKCDRNYPCNNCTKAGAECISPATLPPKKRKKRFPEAELLARLRRYEEALRRYGADIDAINSQGLEGAPLQSPFPASSIDPTAVTTRAEQLFTLEPPRSLAIRKSLLKAGHKHWTVSEEFQEAEEALQGSSEDEIYEGPISQTYDAINADGGDIIFPSPITDGDLRDLHPTPVQIFKLWQTYLDNVNPVVKLFHTPTVQQKILEASTDLDNIPKGLEALMFGIYCVAVMSLNTTEWDSAFGLEERPIMLARYQTGARQALSRAGLMRSSDMTILQAYVLYLLSCMNFSIDPRSLFCLTGIAIRIAQRMGLNYDGTSFGLPPFEVEMRRRLWWQLILMDFRVAELSGAGPTVLTHVWTTKLPYNVNDSDLYPDMKEPPIEHAGVSEMVYVLQRAEACEVIQRFRNLTIPTTMAMKDKIVGDLAKLLETKYIQHCDPSIPLHLLATHMARTLISKMHMGPRHPHSTFRLDKTPNKEDRDHLIQLSIQMIESHNAMMSAPQLRRFLWHIMTNFPFPAHLYLLCTLRHMTSGDLCERAWEALGNSHFLREDSRLHDNRNNTRFKHSSMYIALSNLTIKAWDARALAHPEIPEPSFITFLKAHVASKKSEKSTPTETRVETPTAYIGEVIDTNFNDSFDPNATQFYQNGETTMQGMTMEMSLDPMVGWRDNAGQGGNLSWDFWNDLMRMSGSAPMEGQGNQNMFDGGMGGVGMNQHQY